MPPDDSNQIANEDFMELEIAHDESSQSSDFQSDDFQSDDFQDLSPGNVKLRTLFKKIDASKINRSAITPFLAAVEIDMERPYSIGLKKLFTLWLERGNKYWLNPMDKNNGLGLLEEILFKYQGDVHVLAPFVGLLTELAREGISPRSFSEYVILPRMRQDYNWRKWQESHLEALRIISRLIINAKDHPPFNQEHLGSGHTRLARDIVLVRYIGRPLAQFQVTQLRDDEKLESYMQAWQKISLHEPLSLYFMRNNALHFIYSMSGKIDLVQLTAVVEQLPDIERAFTSAFPDGNIKLKKIQAINLYDYDIDFALQERRKSGFHSLDFALEIRAYFNIVKALLEKPTGVYLCAYYAGLLKRYKNPFIAETIFNLVRVIDDCGGMHIYKWHTKKLLEKPRDSMRDYLGFIEENNGCDPEYPRLGLLFRDEETARETLDVFELADNFGLADNSGLKDRESVSYKDLLNAYIEEYPDTADLIDDFQQQMLVGRDRQWNGEYTQKLDILSGNKKSLYGPLLRSVIRGIGSGWMYISKSSCFTQLLEKYGSIHTQLFINARSSFDMPVKPVGGTSAQRDAQARKQVNLSPVEKIWQSLCNTEQGNVNNTLAFINRWSIELNEPLDKAFDKKVSFEKEMRENEDEEIRKKLERDIAKQDKAIGALQEKKQHYTKVIEQFDALDDEQKFIASLVLAGAAGMTDEQFSSVVTALLLQRYKHLESIASRLNFLLEDISVDVISYQQFTFLLNFLETLFFVLREDSQVAGLLEEDTVLQEILEPYIITKNKRITIDALDAAAKKMTGYAALQAERAKWQGIIVSMEEKDEKYFHSMEIYTSKTFIDSHYGDMGGICLSSQPDQILRPGFYIQRLADLTDRQIIGMSILYLSTGGFSSPQVRAVNYWQAFAFNPLSSVLSHFTTEQQLFLYLQYRLNMEKAAWMTKLPVVLSGVDTMWGLISNNEHFGNLIRSYEAAKPTAKKVHNAKGLSVYYSSLEFANALVIIDPRGYEHLEDLSQVPTFYAHRELGEIPEKI